MDFIKMIFPELAESDDERIRKAIHIYLDWLDGRNKDYQPKGDYSIKDMIAWLEKQNSNVDNANKEYWRGYREGKQEILDKYAELEKQGEQKEINLIEILKHYPRETELYSPLYGKLWLAKVDEKNEIITCYKYPLNKGCTRAILEQEETVSFYSNGTTGLPDFNISKDCMLFLYDIEKQGKQKPTDKVEAKFKVGDWCIDNEDGTIFQIVKVLDNTYTYKTNKGKEYSCSHYSLENDAHLWTIKDAKDGDILELDCGIGIFKDNCIDGYNIHCYCYYSYEDVLEINKDSLYDNYQSHPATKEQCERFFVAMYDAGYEWDTEKKELKKIVQKPADSYCQKNCKGFQETGKCFADGDCKAKREVEFIDIC